MRCRSLQLALAGLTAVLAASCAGCGWWRSSRASVEVRWPATAPAARATPLGSRTHEGAATEELLAPTEVAPGMRVREGVVHDLAYLEVILGEADFDDPLPLVVLLHGRGDRPRIPGGPFTAVPTPMRLIIPRGPLRVGDGFAWVLSSVTQNQPELLARSLLTRTQHLAALIKTLAETRPTLGRPLVTGFSQGGMLAFSLALHRPDVVGGAFPIAGWVPPALMPLEPLPPELRVPILALHGTDDRVIPVAPTREVVAALRALEWNAELVEFEGVGHVVSREMNARFEIWLEEALRTAAGGLDGKGLGQPGPEDETYEPFEPLDPETVDAVEPSEPEAAPPSTDDDEAEEGTSPSTGGEQEQADSPAP